MSAELLARFAALRAKTGDTNLSPLSECRTCHTLSTLLLLYNKANKSCYVNYMEGAKALLYFLTNGRVDKLDLEVDKYPKILDTSFKVPRLLSGYESYELAKVIAGTSLYSDPYLQQVDRAIHLTMLDLVNRGLI